METILIILSAIVGLAVGLLFSALITYLLERKDLRFWRSYWFRNY